MKKLAVASFPFGDYSGDFDAEGGDVFREVVKNGEYYFDRAYSVSAGSYTYKTFVPIKVGDTNTPWSFGAVVSESEMLASANAATKIAALVGILGVIILTLITLFITRNNIGEKMASGDFSEDVPEKLQRRRDEIGALAKMVQSLSMNFTLKKRKSER